MPTRVVTSLIKEADGPIPNFGVRFTVIPSQYTPEAHHPQMVFEKQTDDHGELRVELEQGLRYKVDLVGAWVKHANGSITNVEGNTFSIVVPEGAGPISLEELRAVGVPQKPVNEALSDIVYERLIDGVPVIVVDAMVNDPDVHAVVESVTEQTSLVVIADALGGIQSQIDEKADATSLAPLVNHTGDTNNPHGTTKSQVGLSNVPNVDATDRDNHTGSQPASTISGLSNAVDSRINAQKGQASGVASLDETGHVPLSQLNPSALTSVFEVENEVEMLALDAQEGDVAIRSDLSRSFIHNGGTAGAVSDWTELATPTDAVRSVAGRNGDVTLTKSDVGLNNVDNTPDLDKPVSIEQQAALDTKANAIALSQHMNDTDNPHGVTATQVGAYTTAQADTAIATRAAAASAKGYVNHGSDAGVARPTGYASIEWVGTVQPANMVNGDTWLVMPS